MMKHRVFLAAVLLTALAFSQSAKAYDFSAVAPSGQTLYYNIVDSTVQVTCQNSSSPYYSTYPTGALTIPATVTYNDTTYLVTKIGNHAFDYCSGLTSITIPNTVASIGENAFGECSGLTSVTIPNSVTRISNYAFSGCNGLTSITIPNSVTAIGVEAFRSCTGLTSITVDAGNRVYDSRNNCNAIIETYHNRLIAGCQNTVIPSTVTYIGLGSFCGQSGMTSVFIPNSVTSIEQYAFSGCWNLTSITIPNSVTTIDNRAFASCFGLTSVTIGCSVTRIGHFAFFGCRGLTEIHSQANVAPQLGTDAFSYVPDTIPVYIPCGSIASYRSNWAYFTNFNEIFLPTLTAQSSDTTMGTVAITTSPTCSDSIAVVTATANSGYLFDHWSDGSTSNPYTFTVTSDTTVIAYFVREEDPEGITDANNDNVSVYARDGRIVVTGTDGESVQVFDITGRPVNSHSPLPTGVYMVKVGNLPIRKVVVLK
jgi:hypothetical protein